MVLFEARGKSFVFWRFQNPRPQVRAVKTIDGCAARKNDVLLMEDTNLGSDKPWGVGTFVGTPVGFAEQARGFDCRFESLN